MEKENLRRNLDRVACARANQQELITCAKKCGHEEEGNFGRGEFRTPTQG